MRYSYIGLCCQTSRFPSRRTSLLSRPGATRLITSLCTVGWPGGFSATGGAAAGLAGSLLEAAAGAEVAGAAAGFDAVGDEAGAAPEHAVSAMAQRHPATRTKRRIPDDRDTVDLPSSDETDRPSRAITRRPDRGAHDGSTTADGSLSPVDSELGAVDAAPLLRTSQMDLGRAAQYGSRSLRR